MRRSTLSSTSKTVAMLGAKSLLTLIIVCVLLRFTAAFNAVSRFATRTHKSARTIEMKGKKVPIQFRGEYLKQKRMQEAQSAYEASKRKDVPYFQLFVRPKVAGPWVPFAELAGDQRAVAIVNAWTSGFLTDFYKGQMDASIARSLFANFDETVKAVRANCPIVKNIDDNELSFGYKVSFTGVAEKFPDQKVTQVSAEMLSKKSWFDNLKESVVNAFSFNRQEDEEVDEKKSK